MKTFKKGLLIAVATLGFLIADPFLWVLVIVGAVGLVYYIAYCAGRYASAFEF